MSRRLFALQKDFSTFGTCSANGLVLYAYLHTAVQFTNDFPQGSRAVHNSPVSGKAEVMTRISQTGGESPWNGKWCMCSALEIAWNLTSSASACSVLSYSLFDKSASTWHYLIVHITYITYLIFTANLWYRSITSLSSLISSSSWTFTEEWVFFPLELI